MKPIEPALFNPYLLPAEELSETTNGQFVSKDEALTPKEPVLEVFTDDRIVAGQYGQNDFVVINNKVGIGTNNPLAKLHVTGSSSVPSAIFIGNVGIGSTSPGALLDVNGLFRFQQDIRVNNGTDKLILSATSTTTELHSAGTTGIVFKNSGNNEIVRFDAATGNVGIGTSSPAAKLDIASTQSDGIIMRYDTSTAYQAWIRPYWNSTADTRIDFAINRAANSTPDVIMSVGYGGNVGIGTTAPGARLEISSSTAASLLNVKGVGGNAILFVSGSGTVGIGTTSPSQLLHVYKSNSGGLGGAIMIDNNNLAVANETALMFGDGGASYIRAAISSTTENAPYYGDIKFKTGLSVYSSLTTRMIIKGDGNVGIGTTLPAYKLDVNSSIVSRSNISTPRFSSAGGYVYGITNSPSWTTYLGGYTNNNATAPDGTTSAGTYTFTATVGGYDLYQTISSLTVGRVYTTGILRL